jgi:hypothetical protein
VKYCGLSQWNCPLNSKFYVFEKKEKEKRKKKRKGFANPLPLLPSCELVYLPDTLSSFGHFFASLPLCLFPLPLVPFYCFWLLNCLFYAQSTFLAGPTLSLTPPPVISGSVRVHCHLSQLFPCVLAIFPRQPSSLMWFPLWFSCFFFFLAFLIRFCVCFFRCLLLLFLLVV